MRGVLNGQSGTGFPGPWKEKASGEVFGSAIAKNDPVVLGRYGSWDTTIDKIPDISGLDGYVNDVSHYGDYMALAMANAAASEIYIYKRTGINDAFTKLSNLTGAGSATGQCVEFSKDGNFLAYGISSSPYYRVFSRSGDIFTLLSDANSFAVPNDIVNLSFSPDGNYLALATDTATVYIFKYSGTSYNYLQSLSTVVPSVNGVCFSPDGNYFVSVGATSVFIKIFSHSGDAFTAITSPAALPTGQCYDCCFSPDGNYLAVLHQTTPRLTVYKRSGSTFTKLANPTTLPGGDPTFLNSIEFDSSSTYLTLTTQATTPYVYVYKIINDTLTKQANPSSIPSGTTYGCGFSNDDLYLSICIADSPYMINYRTTAKDIVSKISHFQTNPLSWLPSNDNIGIATQVGAVGETINVNLFPALNNL